MTSTISLLQNCDEITKNQLMDMGMIDKIPALTQCQVTGRFRKYLHHF